MQGLKAKFEFNGKTYALQRAQFSEMAEYIDRISDNEVVSILTEAAGEKAEAFTAELENNPALVGLLWTEYL